MLEHKKVNENCNRGITLIALVITIIVLLILAGVSINLVVGDNGVLGQARNAVSENDEAKIKEEISMAASSWGTDKYVASTLGNDNDEKAFEDFKKALPKNFDATKNADGTLSVEGTSGEKDYKYFVLDDGSVVTDDLIERVKQGDYVNYSSPCLSGGENWRVFYTEGNKIYLISTEPTEIVQPSNNDVEENEESVKNFVQTLTSERNSGVTLKIGRDKNNYPDDIIESKEINYISELANKYQLTLTIEQVTKALGLEFNIGSNYDYAYFQAKDTKNLFTLSPNCYFFGNYYGNVGNASTPKNCIYMWWSNTGGIGPCWALSAGFKPGTKIRPVVELKEGIKVTNGNGSLEYPYQIEL